MLDHRLVWLYLSWNQWSKNEATVVYYVTRFRHVYRICDVTKDSCKGRWL